MASKKGKKVTQLKQNAGSNSLETGKSIEAFSKAPGQTGLAAPNAMDAIRKPKSSQRKEGIAYFGGVSEPRVADQTYDCYNPIKKNSAKKKKK